MSRLWLSATRDDHYKAWPILLTSTRTIVQPTLYSALKCWAFFPSKPQLHFSSSTTSTKIPQTFCSRRFWLSFSMLTILHYLIGSSYSSYTSNNGIVARSSLRARKPPIELSLAQNYVRLLSTSAPRLYHPSRLPRFRNCWLSCYRYAMMRCLRIQRRIHN